MIVEQLIQKLEKVPKNYGVLLEYDDEETDETYTYEMIRVDVDENCKMVTFT